ncbi:MAG: LVIVD repeat-containing protein, partial [Gemmatimonas sp.]
MRILSPSLPARGALALLGLSAAVAHAQPVPDTRVGLRAGWFDAGEATWNMKLVSATPPSDAFLSKNAPDARLKNSDLAFSGTRVFQGNYSGWQVWDIADPRKPKLRAAVVCPGSQSDVTVYGNLLFVSAEAVAGRVDCGLEGVEAEVSKDRARGIRIFDISNIEKPKSIKVVQTCRGSHTNTLVTDPNDPENVYIYVSGSAGVRSNQELEGCSAGAPDADPNTALFRIEVIKVPVKNPQAAAIVSSPRIFEGLGEAKRHGDAPGDRRERPEGAPMRPSVAGRGPTQCHDITTYPALGLAGGACSGYGILLDIKDIKNPKRLYAAADTNMSAWHSATFSNDGSKVLFSDEWGGGSSPRCRATDKVEWGADAIFVRKGDSLDFRSYFKLPAAQTSQENCVAHNGSLIPVPGREIMVQSWYQGGINVFDWTNPDKAFEIAYFDRGPVDATRLTSAGHWSAYWYNGYIYGSEIARGLDVLELTPSEFLSQNELDAAKLVKFAYFNPQEQPKLVWPAAFVVARAYTDQLARNSAVPKAWLDGVVTQLASAEKAKGSAR